MAYCPDAIGSKSRLTPSAPLLADLRGDLLGRPRLAVGVDRAWVWAAAPALSQAKLSIVSATRVPWACAALMTDVIVELFQPFQPLPELVERAVVAGSVPVMSTLRSMPK